MCLLQCKQVDITITKKPGAANIILCITMYKYIIIQYYSFKQKHT